MTASLHGRYRPTESQYKGGAHDMYVTYDLEQRAQNGAGGVVPKVKRIYFAGHVTRWSVGEYKKRSGRAVFGVRIEYTQTRAGYRRASHKVKTGTTTLDAKGAQVDPATVRFARVVDLPAMARQVRFYEDRGGLPGRFDRELQRVRSCRGAAPERMASRTLRPAPVKPACPRAPLWSGSFRKSFRRTYAKARKHIAASVPIRTSGPSPCLGLTLNGSHQKMQTFRSVRTASTPAQESARFLDVTRNGIQMRQGLF